MNVKSTAIDLMFPRLSYSSKQSPLQWGRQHGEEFRESIRELFEIRLALMQQRSPVLKGQRLNSEAMSQWSITKKEYPLIWEELQGIAEGAKLGPVEITVLNNYTDFRDLGMSDQGCSTVAFRSSHGHVIAGQTWDMHASAKRFLCTIDVPHNQQGPAQTVLSLVGCVGLSGVNSSSCFIGVNNLTGTDARAGVIWPALVREILRCANLAGMRDVLLKAPVTSAHNYLLADSTKAEMWEVFCTRSALASSLSSQNSICHTNHCLAQDTIALEAKTGVASTTVDRLQKLVERQSGLKDEKTLFELLTNHDGYPKSICSHFQSGAADPSTTCGGIVSNLSTLRSNLWRGCPHDDGDGFVSYESATS